MEDRTVEHNIQDQASNNEPSNDVANPWKKEAIEWTKAIVVAVVLVLIIRTFLFAPFQVKGESMDPNFANSERIIVNKILYSAFRKPHRGEVIVFHAPANEDYIKRVIGLPGEKVKVEGDDVFINGQKIDEPFLKNAYDQAHAEGRIYNNRNFPETVVPEGTVFAMGDNRSNSQDSRFAEVGFIPYDKIVGRAELIFWPLDNISLVLF
jgi:signal peptidase I